MEPSDDLVVTDDAMSEEEAAEAEADDMMMAPAAPVEYLAHTPAKPKHDPRLQVLKSLSFRRTLIPILLTTGALLLVLCAGVFVVGADSPFANLRTSANVWIPIAMAITALLLLGLAAFNMLHVRYQLMQAENPAPAGGAAHP
jgi:hypothetical protein